MSILIVYDSIFGNTGQVAKAMADELGRSHEVKLASVQEARSLDLSGVELLLVGSPTRGFRPTPEIQEFASRSDLPKRAAVFDTRIDLDTIHPAPLRWVVQAGGYAAERLRTELEEQGCSIIGEPEGFVVLGQEGPLRDNELERAAAWAKSLMEPPQMEARA
jgi:flavodoxin